MGRFGRATVLSAVLLLVFGAPCRAEEAALISHPVRTVVLDAKHFYLAPSNMIRLGLGVAADAVPANTNLDRWIRDKYQDDIRSGGTDDIAKAAKLPGNVFFAVPLYVGAYGAGYWLENAALKEWSQRSFRATVVGAPALLVLGTAIGSDRPRDGSSHWQPFRTSEGVSGHAYVGAVPLITAAEMSENPYWKGLFFALSALPGLSRINDNEHYLSQVALGWYLAYLSCKVVSVGETGPSGGTKIGIAPLPGGLALMVHRVF